MQKVRGEIVTIKNAKDSIKLAVEIGIDTTGGTSRDAKTLEGIKKVSSDGLGAFRSAFQECDKSSKFIIIDVSSKVTK